MTPLIETRGVSKHYGAFRALDDISIAVRAGEFVSIVGPNGAGKTTLVNLLTGLLVPTNGEVYFKGENIAGVGPVALATRGMARTFQLVQVFPQLTVAETIGAAVVTHQGKQWRLLSPLLRRRGDQRARCRDRRHLRPRAAARDAVAPAVAGREEAARRRIRLCPAPAGDPARRADVGRVHGREARR